MGLFDFLADILFDYAQTYIDNRGYERFSDSDRHVHRWAAEKKLGRKLRAGEVVHHIDRDKQNNSPNNLWVFKNQKEHDRIHKMDARRHGKKASYQGFRSNAEDDNSKSEWFDDFMDILFD